MTHFYGAGCSFVNLMTNQPYSLGDAILSCKDINTNVPDQCRAHFDDYVFCLNGVSSSTCTSCTQEQDALFACH